ncbi:hypothetical protein [Coxiella endosymbiont of Ornithodoros maritimus]|nr:hypothetical protein [Coxiella endosymbiont of Ornithodoros maritimus]
MMRRSSVESKKTQAMITIVHDVAKQGDVRALKQMDKLFPFRRGGL